MSAQATLTRPAIKAVLHALGPWFWEIVRQDPRAYIPPYDSITGYSTWAEFGEVDAQFTGIYAHAHAREGVGESKSPA
ncbi:hypothetical protein [Streptomyces sp. NPDC010273]|uniref:hypothetical protein n=1 Tax=Streptomyces sp. NPDC010273 TaxID=3364829 RepID=UPI0036EA2667